MAFDKAKFLARFVEEAKEHVKSLNDGILALEKNQDDEETLNAVFRSAHTIKGSSRMMKLIAVSELAHRLEDALDAIRKKKIAPSKELSDLLFDGIAEIGNMIDRISAGETIEEPPAGICEDLENAAKGEIRIAKKPVAVSKTPDKASEISQIPDKTSEAPKTPDKTSEASKTPDKPSEVSKTPEVFSPTDTSSEKRVEPEIESQPVMKKSLVAEKPQKPPETVRIGAGKLDELINLMGEIVSSHSRSKQRLADIGEIEQLSRSNMELVSSLSVRSGLPKDVRNKILGSAENLFARLKKFASVFKEDLNVQGLLTSDLQDRSLKMRMLPLSTIFDSFRMSVRNIARSAEKEVDFIIRGGETELDKKIIEQIGDSILHMIRNSIDHGIETPEDRLRAGKPETGTIMLKAAYEGGNVLIEVADDGAGISVDRLREKALKKKLYDEDTIESATEDEIINLIFRPGFSTSEFVTDLSGRGVGMDVVRKNIIENLKGAIHIETKKGAGTTFHIRLPLTMAIIHVLFVSVSKMTFAVPANFITEIIRVPATEVIAVMNHKAVRLREHIIPIVNLNEILRIPTESLPETEHGETEYLALITSMGSEKIGLAVDSLLDEEDVVIKPLPPHMADARFVSGGIISGTNEIVNVLHMPKIMEAAKEVKGARKENGKQAKEKAQKNILVVDDSVSTREIEKSILESYGYRVSLAGDGLEGLEKARNENFDLVITDIEMPGMDGFRLTEELRKDEAYREKPIILISSLSKEDDKKRGMQAGADAYIVKGDFEQTTLLETVRDLTGE